MMKAQRDIVIRRIADLVGGRAVRWLPANRVIGDYDGRENTVEIFDVEAGEQRAMLRRIGVVRASAAAAIGGPLVVIFHTPSETTRLYPQMSSRRSYRGLADSITKWMTQERIAEPALEPEQIPRLTFDEAEAA